MLKLALSCALIGLVHGGFFPFGDMDDPFAMLWNSHTGQKFSACTMANNPTGKCMNKGACLLSGGKPTSTKCGLFQNCCSYETNCFQQSKKKEGYFESGTLDDGTTMCRYTIFMRNQNVCQVRLDFEELVLASTFQLVDETEVQYKCSNDSLKITPSNYGIPVLCGYNNKQHVYVHLNQSEHPEGAVTIDIQLMRRGDEGNANMVTPSWKIKFTQLECPMRRHKFDLATYSEVENINNDFHLLAPEGAIQYFAEPSGEIRSFGYNTSEADDSPTLANYLTAQHYTMAFRRPATICGIRFTNVQIDILPDTDKICYHYLYVPEMKPKTPTSQTSGLLTEGILNDDHICGSLKNSFGTPQGAVQFFSSPTGELRSFGYDLTNQYSTGEHYTIAFRRPLNVCGIKFSNETFSIETPTSAKPDICNHYLLIPEQWPKTFSTANILPGAVFGDNHICASSVPDLLYSLSPGPLYINFKSLSTSIKKDFRFKGFAMNYELVVDCP